MRQALHPISRQRKTTRALTIIEAVMVAALISLLVIFTLGLVPSFKLANRRAGIELHAGNLAQSQLEQLRIAPFDSVGSMSFADVTIDGVTYHSAVRISDIVSYGTPPIEIAERVRVEVSWEWNQKPYKTFREAKICRTLRS